jgi:carboxypeptidase PM20D1
MKKTLFTLLAIVAVLAATVVVRTVRLPSRQGEGQAGVTIQVDPEGAAERFAGAIRIPTISWERVEDTDTAAFLALHDYLERTYPLVHEHLVREKVADLSLLYTWEGTDPSLEPIVLMGHQDVVPVVPGTEGDWEHPPFSGDVVDGEVWGRGTMDDKISVVSILEAVEALLAQGFRPRHTIYLAFGHDEEVGGVRGASAIADLLESRGVGSFAFVTDEGGAVVRDMIPGVDGTIAIVGVAEKGYVNVELLVEGAGGHSSAPPPQTNIGVLAEAVSSLEENPFPARFEGPARLMFDYLAPEMSFGRKMVFANLWLFRPVVEHFLSADPQTAAMVHTTTAPTIISGGVKANVLPISARALVNHRILPGETKESVLERDRQVIDDDRVQVRIFGDDGVDPSPVSETEGPAFRLLERTIRQVLPEERVVVAPFLVPGGTDAKYYARRSPNVLRFLPAVIGPRALELAHGTNERMSVEGLTTSIRYFQQLIRNTDEL